MRFTVHPSNDGECLMGLNSFNNVVLKSNFVHYQEIALALVQMKRFLTANAASALQRLQAQEQFYYAAISTQNFSSYNLSIVTLPQTPSEIWRDINNIPQLKEQSDLDSQLKVAIACFARLLIQARKIAEEGKSGASEIDVTSEHAKEETFLVLQYLNENDSIIPTYQQWVTENQDYQGYAALNLLQSYIPLLSPIQLIRKDTILVTSHKLYFTESEQFTYFELLRFLDDAWIDIADHQQQLREYQGSYGLYYYPAIEYSNKPHTCHVFSLMLSHFAPMQLLRYQNNAKDLSEELQSVLRFVTRFVETKLAMREMLTYHGVQTTFDDNASLIESSEALQLLFDSPKELYSSKTRADLAFAHQSIAYMPSAQDFLNQTSIVKILYTHPLEYRVFPSDLIERVVSITKYTKAIIERQQAIPNYQPYYYYYLGITKEWANTYHLLLIMSLKSPTEFFAAHNSGTNNLTSIEQNILNFASLLHHAEKIIQKNAISTAPQSITDNLTLEETLNVLNTNQLNKIYRSTPSFKTRQPTIEIPPIALSELDIENKEFITRIQFGLDAYDINTFTYSVLLDTLIYITSSVNAHNSRNETHLPSRAYYYYPCLAKKSLEELYVHTVISHIQPTEVLARLSRQGKTIEKLSKEELGIALCCKVFFQAQKAISIRNNRCQILKNQEESTDELVDFLTLLNDQAKHEPLKTRKSQTNTTIILTEITDLIPYAPANRLNTEPPPLYSNDSRPPSLSKTKHYSQRGQLDPHLPSLKYQRY